MNTWTRSRPARKNAADWFARVSCSLYQQLQRQGGLEAVALLGMSADERIDMDTMGHGADVGYSRFIHCITCGQPIPAGEVMYRKTPTMFNNMPALKLFGRCESCDHNASHGWFTWIETVGRHGGPSGSTPHGCVPEWVEPEIGEQLNELRGALC